MDDSIDYFAKLLKIEKGVEPKLRLPKHSFDFQGIRQFNNEELSLASDVRVIPGLCSASELGQKVVRALSGESPRLEAVLALMEYVSKLGRLEEFTDGYMEASGKYNFAKYISHSFIRHALVKLEPQSPLLTRLDSLFLDFPNKKPYSLKRHG